MNAAVRIPQQSVAPARRFYVEPLLVFVARAEPRAMLFAAGELDLQGAVDELQLAAERDGLVDDLGQEAAREYHAARGVTIPAARVTEGANGDDREEPLLRAAAENWSKVENLLRGRS